jgi:hypothetical protein
MCPVMQMGVITGNSEVTCTGVEACSATTSKGGAKVVCVDDYSCHQLVSLPLWLCQPIMTPLARQP